MMCQQFFTDCITLIGDATLNIVEFYLVLEFYDSSPLIGSRSHRDYWCTNFTGTTARSYAGIVSPIGSSWRDVIRQCHKLTQSALIVRLTTWATKCSVDWHLGCASLARKRPVCYSSNMNSSGQALLSTGYRSHLSVTNCCLPASPVHEALLYIYHGRPTNSPNLPVFCGFTFSSRREVDQKAMRLSALHDSSCCNASCFLPGKSVFAKFKAMPAFPQEFK